MENKAKEGQVIQITDEKHSWYPSLLIVKDAYKWGVQAYVIIPKSNDGSEAPSMAFIRLNNDTFEVVGDSIIKAY